MASVQTRSPSKWVAAISRELQWNPVGGRRLETGVRSMKPPSMQNTDGYSLSKYIMTFHDITVRCIPLFMGHWGFVCAWRTFQWRPHHHEDSAWRCLKHSPPNMSQCRIIFLRFCINWFAQEKRHSLATTHIISYAGCHLQKLVQHQLFNCFMFRPPGEAEDGFCQMPASWWGEADGMAWRKRIFTEYVGNFVQMRFLNRGVFLHLRMNDRYLDILYYY